MPAPDHVYLDDDFETDDLDEVNPAPGEDALEPDSQDLEEITMQTQAPKPANTHIKGGVRGDDDRAAEAAPADHLEGDERQEALLDEGVEETFPASDPVSVKRIT